MSLSFDSTFRIHDHAFRFRLASWNDKTPVIVWYAPLINPLNQHDVLSALNDVFVNLLLKARWTGSVSFDTANGVVLTPEQDTSLLSPGLQSGVRNAIAQVLGNWYAVYLDDLRHARQTSAITTQLKQTLRDTIVVLWQKEAFYGRPQKLIDVQKSIVIQFSQREQGAPVVEGPNAFDLVIRPDVDGRAVHVRLTSAGNPFSGSIESFYGKQILDATIRSIPFMERVRDAARREIKSTKEDMNPAGSHP